MPDEKVINDCKERVAMELFTSLRRNQLKNWDEDLPPQNTEEFLQLFVRCLDAVNGVYKPQKK